MRNILFNISKKIDKAILKTLIDIKNLTDSLQIDFFLLGATVRDIILHYIYDIKIYRATNDIDLAIRVKSWDDYNRLTNHLDSIGLERDKRIVHRFYSNSLIIDFIPFGEIADANYNIAWQDNDKKEMSILGFDDVYFNTNEVIIQDNPFVSVKMASLESLTLLKILSWNDRSIMDRIKDAKDLHLIITKYLLAGNEKTLFDKHLDIIESTTDYEITGARLLGRDIANMASMKVKDKLLEILQDDKLKTLSNEMAHYDVFSDIDEKIEKNTELLLNLRLGLTEKTQ